MTTKAEVMKDQEPEVTKDREPKQEVEAETEVQNLIETTATKEDTDQGQDRINQDIVIAAIHQDHRDTTSELG